jgi:hypothetical protein
VEDVHIFSYSEGLGSLPSLDGEGDAVHGATAEASGHPARASTSVDDFIQSFVKPLPVPIILSPPRLRQTRVPRQRDDSELVPKRSARLAAKSKHRAPNPEVQARRVKLKRIGAYEENEEPDTASYDEYMTAFAPPLSSSTREAMEVLYPGRKQRAC